MKSINNKIDKALVFVAILISLYVFFLIFVGFFNTSFHESKMKIVYGNKSYNSEKSLVNDFSILSKESVAYNIFKCAQIGDSDFLDWDSSLKCVQKWNIDSDKLFDSNDVEKMRPYIQEVRYVDIMYPSSSYMTMKHLIDEGYIPLGIGIYIMNGHPIYEMYKIASMPKKHSDFLNNYTKQQLNAEYK